MDPIANLLGLLIAALVLGRPVIWVIIDPVADLLNDSYGRPFQPAPYAFNINSHPIRLEGDRGHAQTWKPKA